MTGLPVNRHDWCPLDYIIPTTEWVVELDPIKTRVTATMTVMPNPDGRSGHPLVLQGQGLEWVSCRVDGREVVPTLTDTTLTLPPIKRPTEIQLVTHCHPKGNTALEGLYWVDGVFCTQNEPEGLRRITYFTDRPDQLTRYTITLVAPHSIPTLLANGHLVAKGEWDPGRHFATWEDPFPKPSYLVAMVAGSFDRIEDVFHTQSGRSIQLEIYSDPGTANRCWHAMNSLKRAMKWDETVYQREYDLDRFMIVATHTFNMGAMENTGLNIFNAAYVHYDTATATDGDYLNVERVVAHEYFHHWTGNRITCRDWFQLTLKEGLTVYRDQCFSGDMNSPAVQRVLDVVQLMDRQFEEDAGPMAHPIQPETYLEINNFYTATVYEKGAEVIRMMALLANHAESMGSGDGFLSAIQTYFTRHQGQAVTTDHFIRAIEDGGKINLSAFRTWYHQAGTPHVDITLLDRQGDEWVFEFRQSCRNTPESSLKLPFVIPIQMAMLGPDGVPVRVYVPGEPATASPLVVLSDQSCTLRCHAPGGHCPSFFRGLSAPVTWDYPYTYDDRVWMMQHEPDPVSRYWHTQFVTQHHMLNGDSTWPLSVMMAYRGWLEAMEDPAFISLLLTPPPLSRLMRSANGFPLHEVAASRLALVRSMGTHLTPLLESVYADCMSQSVPSLGMRQLQNRVLEWLVATDPCYTEWAMTQLTQSNRMALQLGALSALSGADTHPAFDQGLAWFYAQWQHEPLLINKWCAIQSSAPTTGLHRAKELVTHPLFDRLNPNRCRSVVGALAGNWMAFHCQDGYEWVAQQLMLLDPHNPLLAARLATAYQSFSLLDNRRKEWMGAVLMSLLEAKTISPNLFEVVSKIKSV